MPLRCLDPDGRSIQAFDLSQDEWNALRLENKNARHLRMPCCAERVTLKISPRDKKFFAHKSRDACTSVPEREEHLHLKQMAVDAARANGWEAMTEFPGTTPSGEPWIADVLTRKGQHNVAVVIQWSGQTDEETLRRQERYRSSRVRGLWLLRQPDFPVTRDLPAVCIGGDLDNSFEALIPSHGRMSARHRADPAQWHQVVPMREFLDAVFSRRFRFGVPLDADAVVTVRSGMLECWRSSCRAQTRIVTSIEVAFGPHRCNFRIRGFENRPELLSTVLESLPAEPRMGVIKRRFSKTQGRRYLSNGC